MGLACSVGLCRCDYLPDARGNHSRIKHLGVPISHIGRRTEEGLSGDACYVFSSRCTIEVTGLSATYTY